MPIAPRCEFVAPLPFAALLTTSTLLLATPIAGTTHFPQLHCMPCHANFPTFDPQTVFGQVKRPDSGASSDCESRLDGGDGSEEVGGYEEGKRDGRIHVSGCKKM